MCCCAECSAQKGVAERGDKIADMAARIDAARAAELQRRYLAERDKRLHFSTLGRYQPAAGELAHYQADPHAPQPAPRDSVEAEVDVVIIGAGFGGLLIAAELEKAGISNFRSLDQTADLRWVGEGQRWHVSANQNDWLRARFVCLSTGLFQRPPAAVPVRNNEPADASWFQSQEPGWLVSRNSFEVHDRDGPTLSQKSKPGMRACLCRPARQL